MIQRGLKNITEEIVSDRLKKALSIRYDICTCHECRNDMLAYILSRLPAHYATTEQGKMFTMIEQTKFEMENKVCLLIGEAIKVVSQSPRHKIKDDKNQLFMLLLKKIREDRGLDFRNYHQEMLKRRLALRIRANNLNSYSEYMRLLIRDPHEYDLMFATLCINVSEFFRDPEVWITFKCLMETIFRNKKKENRDTIRIWSAACAYGEEPFSIAIVCRELLNQTGLNFNIEISGTDVDKKCLAAVEKAQYQKEAVKNIDAQTLKRYFFHSGDKYILNADIKSTVKFSRLDLTSDKFIEDNDVILCRNAFIYFNHQLQEEIVRKFHASLKPGGYLLLGKVETLLKKSNDLFEEIDSNANIHRKK